jgi:acetylornithine/N-succinyldiaminopimelate aminotransferase
VHGVSGVRGPGLLIAVELAGLDARELTRDLLARGVIVNAVTPTALRLAPSLLISDDELDLATHEIRAAIAGASR